MATYNQMQVQQKPKFSVAITTKGYQSLISNTLRDPARARRFTASITSAVAVNPALQECDVGTILAGALLGESLNFSPSQQLGQYYLVPFKQKAKYDRSGRMIRPESVTATFVLSYKDYIQLEPYVVTRTGDRMRSAMMELTGLDKVGGYTLLDNNGVQHITNRHAGGDGSADATMKNSADVARAAYVLNNFDNAYLAKDRAKGYKDSRGKRAPIVMFEKK